ncbi:MAG: T9SS type A sorting domain-containing protein [Bacteroidetes bacterium]|nr:T9SS type A sorting domain-containing protein [Bacteroidota bacterium]
MELLKGMVYITSSGAQYTGSTISQNEFFIDAYSGDYTSILTRRYIHYNGFGDNFDMGLRINCNFFHHNHLNTPAYNLYGFMLEPEVPPIGPKKEIVKEFYGNIIDDAGSSWLNPQVPFSNDINYFHSNQVLGGNFAVNAALNPNFPNFTTPSTASFCCANEDANTNVSKIYLENPQATNLPYNTYNNTTFYIKGPFDIDQDMTFNNCIFYFTSNGSMNLQGASILDLNACTLQASCDYWLGIIADDPQQKVILQNDSYIKKAGIGLHASNGAVVDVTNSHFEDNINFGIQFENITGNYLGIINNNTFSHTNLPPANYLPPYFKVGIGVENVSHLNIGDFGDANSGNIFNDLHTGILVSHNVNTSCEIGIYNNRFSNIVDNSFGGGNIHSQKINTCYYNDRGAAIIAKFNGVPNVATRLIDVRNTAVANANLKFENCDKGIVSIAFPVKAQNIYMDYCLMGMMNTSTTANVYDVQDNTINNTFIGMQFVGDNANSIAKHNIITHDPSLTWLPTSWPPAMGQQYVWPIGIDLKYTTNLNTNSFLIEDNTITIGDFGGRGIALYNTSATVKARINTITLNNNDVSPIVCAGASDLNGISVENGKGTKIIKNNIYGNINGGLLAQAREDMAGILLNYTKDHELQCNLMSKTRFGVMAWNDCSTDKLNVKGNTVDESVLGWAFRHLVNEGSFGQVGDAGNENNNTFTGPQPSAKVFKFCDNVNNNEVIYTTLVTQGESQSIDFNNQAGLCNYPIIPNPGATPFTACANLIVANNTNTISLDEALAIANNTKVYAEFPELGHWYDSKWLYNYLNKNEDFKNSHADLISFYNTMSNNAIAQEQVAEHWMLELIEAYTQGNAAILQGLQDGTYTANNNIDDTELQDANEAMINLIYLKILRYGIDSVTQADSTFIVELAPQCPYVGGSAVFKARTLNAYYHPGNMFDDMKLCNQVGVFKQGGNNSVNDKSKLTKENEYMQALIHIKQKVSGLNEEIIYYPNPSTNFVYVQFTAESDGVFTLHNSMGEKLFSKKLSREVTKHRIDLENLASGMYHFEIEYANKVKSIGKITIVN